MFENCTIKWKLNDFTGEKNMIKIIHNDRDSIDYVPLVEDNADYQEIMKWVAEGNVIEEEVNDKLAESQAAHDKVIADRASGNQKLKDLGLTDDEIKATTGQ